MTPTAIGITFTTLTICVPLPVEEKQMYIYRNITIQIQTKPKTIFISEGMGTYPTNLCWIVLHFRKVLPVIRYTHLIVRNIFIFLLGHIQNHL